MIKEYTNKELSLYMKSAFNCLPFATGITAFVLNHNYKEIYDKITPYIDKRNEIIQKYGEEQEDGSYAIITAENIEKADAELKDYDELKISMDIIKLPETKMADSGLTAAQMMSLSWMTMHSSAEDIRTMLCIKDDDDDEEEEKSSGSYDVTKPPDDDRF